MTPGPILRVVVYEDYKDGGPWFADGLDVDVLVERETRDGVVDRFVDVFLANVQIRAERGKKPIPETGEDYHPLSADVMSRMRDSDKLADRVAGDYVLRFWHSRQPVPVRGVADALVEIDDDVAVATTRAMLDAGLPPGFLVRAGIKHRQEGGTSRLGEAFGVGMVEAMAELAFDLGMRWRLTLEPREDGKSEERP